mmetsp:Transcript_84569/g.262642  ORF Transcript_84569/g.262642 Transcript_84569/m.262642 type:complete len:524 (+) Transcript_84569:269-1840(+)
MHDHAEEEQAVRGPPQGEHDVQRVVVQAAPAERPLDPGADLEGPVAHLAQEGKEEHGQQRGADGHEDDDALHHRQGLPLQHVLPCRNPLGLFGRELHDRGMLGAVPVQLRAVPREGVLEVVARQRHDAGLEGQGGGQETAREGGVQTAVVRLPRAVVVRRDRPREEGAGEDAGGTHEDHGRRAEEDLDEVQLQDAADDARGPVGPAEEAGDLRLCEAAREKDLLHAPHERLVDHAQLLDFHGLPEEETDHVLPGASDELQDPGHDAGDDDTPPEANGSGAGPRGDDHPGGDVHGDSGDGRQEEHGEADEEEDDDHDTQVHVQKLDVQPRQEDIGPLQGADREEPVDPDDVVDIDEDLAPVPEREAPHDPLGAVRKGRVARRLAAQFPDLLVEPGKGQADRGQRAKRHDDERADRIRGRGHDEHLHHLRLLDAAGDGPLADLQVAPDQQGHGGSAGKGHERARQRHGGRGDAVGDQDDGDDEDQARDGGLDHLLHSTRDFGRVIPRVKDSEDRDDQHGHEADKG